MSGYDCEIWNLYLAAPQDGDRFKLGIASNADTRLSNLRLTDLNMDLSMFVSGDRRLISKAERAMHFMLDAWRNPLEAPCDGFTEWFDMKSLDVAREQLSGIVERDDRLALFSVVFLGNHRPQTAATSVRGDFYVIRSQEQDEQQELHALEQLSDVAATLLPGDAVVLEQFNRFAGLHPRAAQQAFERIQAKGAFVALPGVLDVAEVTDPSRNAFFECRQRLAGEMLISIARKDYEQRRQRQAQGIAKAKAEGRYKGRPRDTAKRKKVRELLEAGFSVRKAAQLADASTYTVQSVKAEMSA